MWVLIVDSMRTVPALGAVTVIVPIVACALEFAEFNSLRQSATACAVTSVPSENL